jgi:hypothetical protein
MFKDTSTVPPINIPGHFKWLLVYTVTFFVWAPVCGVLHQVMYPVRSAPKGSFNPRHPLPFFGFLVFILFSDFIAFLLLETKCKGKPSVRFEFSLVKLHLLRFSCVTAFGDIISTELCIMCTFDKQVASVSNMSIKEMLKCWELRPARTQQCIQNVLRTSVFNFPSFSPSKGLWGI